MYLQNKNDYLKICFTCEPTGQCIAWKRWAWALGRKQCWESVTVEGKPHGNLVEGWRGSSTLSLELEQRMLHNTLTQSVLYEKTARIWNYAEDVRHMDDYCEFTGGGPRGDGSVAKTCILYWPILCQSQFLTFRYIYSYYVARRHPINQVQAYTIV